MNKMLNFHTQAIFLVSIAFSQVAFSSDAKTVNPDHGKAPFQRAHPNDGLTSIPNIRPQQLRFSKASKSTDYCITVVTVNDPGRACAKHHCLRVFPSLEEITLRPGDRALSILPCRANHETQGDLLWGPANPLVFQPERTEHGLWKQEKHRGRWAIRLMTNATNGLLYWGKSDYAWIESEN